MGEEYNRREDETEGGWACPGDQGGQPQPWIAEPQTGQIQELREDGASQEAVGTRFGIVGRGSDSMAMASLVMGILSLVSCCCTCLAVVLGALGIIFAFLSRGEGEMNRQAKAGLILSAAGLAVSLLTLAAAMVIGLLAS